MLLTQNFKPLKKEWAIWNTCEVCGRRWPTNPLTFREWQVAELFAEADSYAKIAEKLVIVKSTVKTHINSIYRKTGMTSKIALTRWVIEIDNYQCRPDVQPPCNFCKFAKSA